MEINVKEAAEQLGVPTSTIYSWIRRGKVKFSEVPNKKLPSGHHFVIDSDSLPTGITGMNHKKVKEPSTDPIDRWLDELIVLGRKLKALMREHDEGVRRDTLKQVGNTLLENSDRR